jgi:hypothetical protein
MENVSMCYEKAYLKKPNLISIIRGQRFLLFSPPVSASAAELKPSALG